MDQSLIHVMNTYAEYSLALEKEPLSDQAGTLERL
jgi:hypothetical protein